MNEFDPQQLWLLILAAAIAGFFLGRATAGGGEDRAEQRMRERRDAEELFATLSGDVQAEVDERIRAKRNIEAIKIVRDATGVGLKAAKNAVDARRGAMGAL